MHGSDVLEQDIYSAAIDALTRTVQHDHSEPYSLIIGVNSPGNVAFEIIPVVNRKLLRSKVVIAYDLLSELVVKDQGKFQEKRCTLNYNGRDIGLMYIKKGFSVERHGGNGEEGTATP